MKILRILLLIALPLFAVGACASGGQAGSDGVSGQEISVTVENTAVPPTSLTVWMVKANTMRQRLGRVRSNSTERFRYTVPGVGQYRFVGEARTGSDVRSQTFTLTDSHTGVSWDIGANSVVVR